MSSLKVIATSAALRGSCCIQAPLKLQCGRYPRRAWTADCPPAGRRCAVMLYRSSTETCSCKAHNSYSEHPSDSSDNEGYRGFQHFLQRPAVLAAGVLVVVVLLVRPVSARWQRLHQPVPDALPAAVWLPRSADGQGVKHMHERQPNPKQTPFAVISSSIPATSSRLLRISDALLMQLTVTLQQVTTRTVVIVSHTHTLPCNGARKWPACGLACPFSF